MRLWASQNRKLARRVCRNSFLLFGAFASCLAGAATPQVIQPGSVMIRVRAADGTPPLAASMVQLTARAGSYRQIAATQDDSQAVFRNVPSGEYNIEVTAMGYQVAREEVTVYPGGEAHIFVLLRSESAPASAPSQPTGTVLAPKARKQFDAAVDAMIKGDLKTAQENLERVLKAAPGYANAHYLLGVLLAKKNDPVQAQASFEKAIGLDPSHSRALFSLGRLHFQQNRYEEAFLALEKALALDNVNWEGHWMMGTVQLARQQYERARTHAERALSLAGNKAPHIALLLAQAQYRLGETTQATQTLEKFLRDTPENTAAPAASRMLSEIRRRDQALSANGAEGKGMAGQEPAVGGPLNSPEPSAEPALPSRNWAPPDVDAEIPPVDATVSCSLPSVLQLTGKRVTSLVENLQGVTARERIELSQFDRSGKPGTVQAQNYAYMMTIQEPRRGVIFVEEDRRVEGLEPLIKQRLASEGLPALALIFHPYYSGDYEMKCEGLTQINGHPAWQVYFRQRPDKPSRIRVYRTLKGRFPIPLKGRAWIGAGHHEILRLETGMLAPLPEAELETEHLLLNYAPVRFAKRNIELWLPSSVDLYTHFRGHRYYMRHSFSNFIYFAVDVKQTIHDPKVDQPKDPPND